MGNFDLRNPAVQKIVLSAMLAAGVLGVFFFTHFLPFSYPTQRDQLVDWGIASERILVEEHRIYPEAIRRVLEEEWRLDGRRVVFAGPRRALR